MVLNLKLLSKVRKSKVVTTQYPFSPIEVTDGFRGKPVIEYDKCMGCGACATVCPPEAITVTRDKDNGILTWRIFYGRCIFCGRCHEVCPLGAIKLSNEFELASLSSEDLYAELDIALAKCSSCGKYFDVTKIEVSVSAEILAKSKELASTTPELTKIATTMCEECRRKESVTKIAKSIVPGLNNSGGA